MWPMLIGMRKTRELLYTAKLIGAAEAQQLGLVNEVASRDALEQTTHALALDIARTPVNHLTLLKHATNRFYENMGMFASWQNGAERSEEHTSELQSLMRISYAVFCLKKKQHLIYKPLKIHHKHNNIIVFRLRMYMLDLSI